MFLMSNFSLTVFLVAKKQQPKKQKLRWRKSGKNEEKLLRVIFLAFG